MYIGKPLKVFEKGNSKNYSVFKGMFHVGLIREDRDKRQGKQLGGCRNTALVSNNGDTS